MLRCTCVGALSQNIRFDELFEKNTCFEFTDTKYHKSFLKYKMKERNAINWIDSFCTFNRAVGENGSVTGKYQRGWFFS